MKFILLAPRFHTNLYYRVIAMQNAGHFVKVLVLYKGKSEYYENIDIEQVRLSLISQLLIKLSKGFKKIYLKSSFELFVQSPGWGLRNKFKSFKPDFVLLKAYQNIFSLKVGLICKLLNIKILMLLQTNKNHIKGSVLLLRINLLLYKFLNVKAYITPILSNYTAFDKIGIKNIYYLPFVYPANKKNKPERQTVEIKVLSVGKFVERKDHLLLIKAIQNLQGTINVKLSIIGEKADIKYYQKISAYIENNSLREVVSLVSNLSYTEIKKQYNQHQLLVLPAYAEPAAYSPVEAMAYGLPVIVSNECGTKCYIPEGINGYIFEARNQSSLEEKIRLIILDKENYEKMSEAAREMAIKYHNLHGFSDKLSSLIEQNT